MDFRFSIFDFRLLLLPVLAIGITACQPAGDETTAEPYAVTVTVSTNRITIGDRVRMQVATAHPENARVDMSGPAETEAWTVSEHRVTRQPLSEGRTRTVHHYTMTSFQLGTHAVATGAVRYITGDADPVVRDFPETVIEVVSLLDDETDAAPIKPPLTWPGRVPRWVPVLIGIAALALAVGLFVARILNKPRTFLHQAPPRPAHETALNALRMLREKQYIESSQVDPYYIELSAIVRRYLEDRFHLRAPESTTEEFIHDAMNARVLTSDHQSLVREFLEQSDLVKFARHRPQPEDMKAAYDAAERLVLETKEPEQNTEARTT